MSSVSIYSKSNSKIITENTLTKPTNSYGISKDAAEKFIFDYCKKNSIDFTIIRPTNVIGFENKPFLDLIKILKKGYFYYIGDYKGIYTNYVSIKHLCHCIIYFIENTKQNDYIINEPLLLNEIIISISKALKVNPPKKSIPKILGLILSFLCDMLQSIMKKNIAFNSQKYSELTNKTIYSSKKIIKDTGIANNNPVLDEISGLTDYYLKNKYL